MANVREIMFVRPSGRTKSNATGEISHALISCVLPPYAEAKPPIGGATGFNPISNDAMFDTPFVFASPDAATVALVPNQPSFQTSGRPSPSVSVHASPSRGLTSVPSRNPSPSVSRTSGFMPAATSSPSETPSRSVSHISGSVSWKNSSSRSERPSPSRSESSASSAESGWNAIEVTFVGSELVAQARFPKDAPTRTFVTASASSRERS